jgi:hypothetical protein
MSYAVFTKGNYVTSFHEFSLYLNIYKQWNVRHKSARIDCHSVGWNFYKYAANFDIFRVSPNSSLVSEQGQGA